MTAVGPDMVNELASRVGSCKEVIMALGNVVVHSCGESATIYY